MRSRKDWFGNDALFMMKLLLFPAALLCLMLLAAGSKHGRTRPALGSSAIGGAATTSPKARELLRFEVHSETRYPVVFARLTAVDSDPFLEANKYKLVAYADGNDDRSPIERLGAEYEDGFWKVEYRIRISPPIAGTYRVDWRLEYTSLAEALRDFPVDTMSFKGDVKGFETAQVSPDDVSSSPLTYGWVTGNDSDGWQAAHVTGICQLPPDLEITIIGDSAPSYLCEQMQWNLRNTNGVVAKCISIKGVLEDVADSYREALLRPPLYNPNSRIKVKRILMFNLAGLWEAAYGQLRSYRATVTDLFELVADSKSQFTSIYYLTTTAVNPSQYRGLKEDRQKWAMTMPRVSELNRVAADVIASKFTNELKLIDLELISLAIGEDDPKEVDDMRHFGYKTNDALINVILHRLCLDQNFANP